MASKKRQQSSKNAAGVDLAQVEVILEFMGKHGLEEFEYAREGLHIRLKKPSAAHSAPVRMMAPQEAIMSPAHTSAAAPAPAREVPAEAGYSEDLHVIKSPIVGTFFGAPSPDAGPFVKVGSRVEPGQVLCIIEAMKLMNEIESDVAGEVVRIFVENGQPVEYGEPLFGILPNRKK